MFLVNVKFLNFLVNALSVSESYLLTGFSFGCLPVIVYFPTSCNNHNPFTFSFGATLW